MTMRPIATLLSSVIASTSSLYGFAAALVGHEVVGLLEVDRVDLVEVDELLDLDRRDSPFGRSDSISLGSTITYWPFEIS